jgi:PAS domain S-box
MQTRQKDIDNKKNTVKNQVLADQEHMKSCGYYALFEQATDAIMVTDLNGNFIDVNSSLCAMIGYTKDELLGKNVSAFIDKDDLKEKPIPYDMLLQGKNTFTERKAVHKDGSIIYLESNAKKCGDNQILVIARNISERKKTDADLQQKITDAVITAEENERQEIGQELHDNVNQLLATARLYIGIARQRIGKKNYELISEADTFIDIAINEIRNISHSLISPFIDEYGLLQAFDHLTTTIQKSSKLNIDKKIEIDENIIDDKLKLAIYRIVQEQLNNIIKYAKATTILISLKHDDDKVLLTIKDNGVGFDTSRSSTGIGLINIRTRASLFKGKLDITSSPGNGCTMKVVFQNPKKSKQ